MERFLNHAVKAQRDVRRNPFGNEAVLEGRLHAAGSGEVRAQELDASNQAEIIQDHRVEAFADPMHIFSEHGDALAQGFQLRQHLGMRTASALHAVDFKLQQGHPLSQIVVHLPPDPSPLRLLRDENLSRETSVDGSVESPAEALSRPQYCPGRALTGGKSHDTVD